MRGSRGYAACMGPVVDVVAGRQGADGVLGMVQGCWGGCGEGTLGEWGGWGSHSGAAAFVVMAWTR